METSVEILKRTESEIRTAKRGFCWCLFGVVLFIFISTVPIPFLPINAPPAILFSFSGIWVFHGLVQLLRWRCSALERNQARLQLTKQEHKAIRN